jgi:hypothetical protein
MSGRGSVAAAPCLLKVEAALAERGFGEKATVGERQSRPERPLAPLEGIE